MYTMCKVLFSALEFMSCKWFSVWDLQPAATSTKFFNKLAIVLSFNQLVDPFSFDIVSQIELVAGVMKLSCFYNMQYFPIHIAILL